MEERLSELEKRTQALEHLVAKFGDKFAHLQAKNLLPVDPEEELKVLKTLLDSAAWPPAVEPSLICNVSSEQDKEDRAEGILDIIIDVHLEGLTVLDFGCGEGHLVRLSQAQNPRLCVGF